MNVITAPWYEMNLTQRSLKGLLETKYMLTYFLIVHEYCMLDVQAGSTFSQLMRCISSKVTVQSEGAFLDTGFLKCFSI